MEAEVIIVGGGLAGLSAAIYLSRARVDTLVVDGAKPMARWEPDVENYLGFPEGIAGAELLKRGRRQAKAFCARFTRDEIEVARLLKNGFSLKGRNHYRCRKVLLATGAFHVPPDIPGVTPCLGHSMFFCKDCDGYRVRGKRIAVYGWTNEAADYALAMLAFSPHVFLVTDGRRPAWDRKHAAWLHEYGVPHYQQRIVNVLRTDTRLRALLLANKTRLPVDALFTTRGERYVNKLARNLGARLDEHGQVIVDAEMRTSVKGLYAAGCVTGANCQMIIAAGDGAIAAQAINRELFDENLAKHSLRRAAVQQ